MHSNDVQPSDRKLLQVIVWTSTIAVAGSLALLFGFQRDGATTRYEFSFASVIAALVGVGVMLLFWRKVFRLLHDQKRLWRFIIISSIVFVIAFIASIFLPRFRPEGVHSGELVQGMVLGFLAVGAVFYFARLTMRLFEQADSKEDENDA